MSSIAIIGGGKIGEALTAGLVASGVNPADIHVTNRNPQRGAYLKQTYGVVPFTENTSAVDEVDVVFLCVKPKQIISVVEEISDVVDNNTATTIVSMAAGITNAAIEEALAAGAPVVRVMPNTPMLVGAGMCAVSPGRFVGEEQLDTVLELLRSVGSVQVIDEADMDAAVAMSGSSPAYLFLIAEAMIDAGVHLGFDRDTARELATQALYGAATMLKETGEEPSQLRANVSSPAGTTITAIRELEESGIRGAFYRATQACAQRSRELGKK
ncbi:pyrroline-5-carboxylate reductase [Corynebacterium sp. sy017]|uniref:pyrroline-5-carboxylate reductase n=1 Tax=unclassified Corynebacterium TaxID=2624378 RepID=UPI00118659EE|nr:MULTISPECIES: pyrroline-5-carboxylate reductase [unclassified Corynebacterium]MBP3089329.1 pyrroline-5-carboxylate reductase [Corynebacterium sp. sy017]QDZ43265.1 pyrroline-5-carboxylate reductase [Corynebacterium sp. sy039]TSD90972.1 pyrroline-5-carboxylate reductase [Corynebacterium sp. SY003]